MEAGRQTANAAAPATTQAGAPAPLRPGWLADDSTWRTYLSALRPEDMAWLDRQWHLAGGGPPALDLSWITTTIVR